MSTIKEILGDATDDLAKEGLVPDDQTLQRWEAERRTKPNLLTPWITNWLPWAAGITIVGSILLTAAQRRL